MCEIVDGRYGVVFVWGIFIDGVFLPGSLTYFYGFSQILLCQCPLNWIYSKCLAKRYYQAIGMPTKNHRGWWCCPRKFSQAAFYFIITIEIALSVFFGILYGAVAFILGVFRTWSVLMNIYLYYLACNAPDDALRYMNILSLCIQTESKTKFLYRPAIYVWSNNEKPLHEDQAAQSNRS